MDNCIVVGAGTYGQVYAEYLKEDYNVIGFIDDNINLIRKKVNEIEIIGNFDFLINFVDKSTKIFIPIGNNVIRSSFLNRLIHLGFDCPSFIHRSVTIPNSVKLGKSVYILPGTCIMPFTSIGDFSLISMGVNIAHHVQVGKGCFFSQGVNIGASMVINDNTFCGIGSTVMTGVTNLGEMSLIGAGAVVTKDVPDFAVVVGNPAKILKYNYLKEVESINPL